MKNLPDWTALGGQWTFDTAIQSSGSGDNFALSGVEATSFIFEADVTFTSSTGAASLVFFAGDNPAKGSYVANIDLSAGNARIFRFESSNSATTKGEYALTAQQKTQKSFRLRVEASDDNLLYFIDGSPVVTIRDDSAKPGSRLGLLTFNTEVRYENVRYATLTGASPSITSISGEGMSGFGTLRRQTAPYGTSSLSYTAIPNGGRLSAAIANASAESVSVSGNTVTVQSISGSFDLILRVESAGISRSYVIRVRVDADPDTLYTEDFRPQYHFSPMQNWLNDPNGLVYNPESGNYHLFFQYNPYGLNIANQVWGHAISRDLIHWRQLDTAIEQDSLGAVFSGSAVVDSDNSSGFFTDNLPGESRLVAIYTSDGGDTAHGIEKQCIAYSKDDGMTWIRPTMEKNGFENPIIANDNNRYGRDFRDPKIFRYDGKWFMVVAGGRARLFTSDNLIDWTMVCDMGFDSECPDFYPLALDGNPDNIKWVYTASGKWYAVGRLEKSGEDSYTFIAETDRIPYNGGSEIYATQSYYNDGTGNRRIAVSWIQDSTAPALSGKGWNGSMTLPYEQTLRTVNGKPVLTSYPVAELDTLRGTQIGSLSGSVSLEQANKLLSAYPGTAYDLILGFHPSEDTVLRLELRSNGICTTTLIYDRQSNLLRVVRSRASSAKEVPSGTMQMPLYPDGEGNITLRILMDQSILEVFGNRGEAALCGMIFPDSSSIGLSLSLEGQSEISSLEVWRMKSIWHGDAEILPEKGLYLFASDSFIPFGESVTVHAFLIDEAGNRVEKKVNWSGADGKFVKTVNTKDTSIEFQGIQVGKITLRATCDGMTGQITLPVADLQFHTNLDGWSSSGDWYLSTDGYAITGSSGDSFTFSDGVNQGTFRYSGTAFFGGQGGCLGLVFGADHPENPTLGRWYGANIDTHSDRPIMKLFCNDKGREIWSETYTFAKSDVKWELTVEYTDDGTLIYTVNGQKVSRKESSLPPGALGLVSWNGGGTFDSVYYEATDSAPGTEPNPPVGNETMPTQPTTDAQTQKPQGQPEGNFEEHPEKKGGFWISLTLGIAIAGICGLTVGIWVKKRKKK